MRYRTAQRIQADLIAIGVDLETARVISAAGDSGKGGLYGQAAKEFAERHAMDLTLTDAQQRALLVLALPEYEAQVNHLAHIPLNQNEFDALVSFDYNRGVGRLSRIASILNHGDRQKAADMLEHFDDAGEQGLKSRRKAEADLMRRRVPGSEPAR